MVKQSFSHGRSKTVVVETKRRRTDGPLPGAPSPAERRAAFDVRGTAAPRPAAPVVSPAQPPSAPVGGLSEDERRARQRVIEEARRVQEQQAAERAAQTTERKEAQAPVAPPAPAAAEEPVAEPAAEAPAPIEPAVAEPARATAPKTLEQARAAMAARSPETVRSPAPGQTRTYAPSRERREERPSTTTYRPERPTTGVAFNQRAARRTLV